MKFNTAVNEIVYLQSSALRVRGYKMRDFGDVNIASRKEAFPVLRPPVHRLTIGEIAYQVIGRALRGGGR